MLLGRLLTSAKHSEKAEHLHLVPLEMTWLHKAVTQVCPAAISSCSYMLRPSNALCCIVKAASYFEADAIFLCPMHDCWTNVLSCGLKHMMYTGP